MIIKLHFTILKDFSIDSLVSFLYTHANFKYSRQIITFPLEFQLFEFLAQLIKVAKNQS